MKLEKFVCRIAFSLVTVSTCRLYLMECVGPKLAYTSFSRVYIDNIYMLFTCISRIAWLDLFRSARANFCL